MEIGLLHGFAATAFTWRSLIPALDLAHRVVALDRPWGARDVQLAATFDELDRHGLERPVLVGHSAGAEIAIMAAIAAPQRIRALVLVAPVVNRGAPAPVRLLVSVPGSGRVGPPLLRVAARWFGPALRSTVEDRTAVTAEVIRGYRDPLLEPGVMESLWAMSRDRPTTKEQVDLARVTQPVLVITGRSDRWTNVKPAPDAEHVVVDRCGHLPHEEHPQQTAGAINQFLATLSGSQPADA